MGHRCIVPFAPMVRAPQKGAWSQGWVLGHVDTAPGWHRGLILLDGC